MKARILAAALVMSYGGQVTAQSLPLTAEAQTQTNYATSIYYVGKYQVSYAYYAINLAAAQQANATGQGIKVAVFDTGLFTNNLKFTGNMTTGYNAFAGVSGTAGVTTDNGVHGTFVSGIIAANTTLNYPNMYGVAPLATIMPIQILDKNNSMTATDKQLAAGINYATANGARILNNSWNSSLTLADLSAGYGATKYVGLMTNSWYKEEIAAWQAAAKAGVVNVWAAGNYGKKDPGYYAALPNVVSGLASSWITVVATDQTGALWSSSNACGVAKAYCMAAPGANMISTYSVNQLGGGSGTSFAAPMVSGAAALMMQKWPKLTGPQIQQLLFTTADKSGIYANTAIYGQGMLDLTKAFAPVGTLTVASSTGGAAVPINGTYIATSSAFGAGVKSMGGITVLGLDGYNRDYQLNMGAAIFAKTSLNSWGDQLALFGGDETKTKDGVTIAGTANGLRSSFAMTSKDGVGAAAGSNISPSLAYGAFANGSVRGSDLVLLNSVGNPYMNMAPNSMSAAVSYGSNSSSTKIGAFTNTVPVDELAQMQRLNVPEMAGGIIEHTLRWDGGYVSASLGMVTESNSILGATSGGALSMGKGANTAFTGITAGFDLDNNWSVFGGGTLGYSMIEASQGSMISSIKGLTSGNAFAGVTKSKVFGDADRLGLVIGMPMRVNSGTATVNALSSFDSDGNMSFSSNKVGLASKSVEFSTQAFYTTELSNDQSLGFGVGARLNAADAKNGTEVIGMARYKLRF